ncbi:GD23551, related [Neospora caninum Liverpool]|uniref:GD23551, related n=1 Tax=Neospora caninum (strain Liverpool) TaxID=572307 RepID=F0VRQ8_NEOCL|nr:GD23551, related [Neospora caninum Liverpool]CBZ56406.1 GD23551, related [Neospora caninum Liverpool]CEL71166.1 TPA: GD23551, related [Neospora caninum Liverpool]|eukprot:XP_003886431.1 GD23551, related [Neospora caninum Liverpool]
MAAETRRRRQRGDAADASSAEPPVTEKSAVDERGCMPGDRSSAHSESAPSTGSPGRRKQASRFWQVLLLLSVGVALRLFLYSVGLTLPETTEPLVSPASASFSSFREALTLQALSFSPYTGGVYRQQPLVFLSLKWITGAGQGEDENCNTGSCRWRYYLVLICIDLVAAIALAAAAAEARTWAMNLRQRTSPGSAAGSAQGKARGPQRKEVPAASGERPPGEEVEEIIASPALVAASYFLHPMTVGAILSLTIHTLPLAFFALALACATRGGMLSRWMCVAFFGCALFVGPPQAFLLALPLAHLMHAVRTQTVQRLDLLEVLPSLKKDILPGLLRGVLLFVAGLAFCAILHVASYFALRAYTADAADYFDSTVIAVWEVRDLGPNLGIFWYILSLGHCFILVVPLFVRMFRYPLAYCGAAIAIALLFQPFFCISDSAFLVTLLISRWDVVERKVAFVKLIVVAFVAVSIYPVTTELWLGRNTGNPNFVYNIQIIFQIFMGFLILEWIKGVVLDRVFTSSGSVEKKEKTA